MPKKKDTALTERFMIRCSPEQMRQWEAEAKRRGFRRGPHDTGVGMLARVLLEEAIESGPRVLPGQPLTPITYNRGGDS